MKTFLYSLLGAVLVVVALALIVNRPQPAAGPVGGIYRAQQYDPQYFRNGLYATQYFGLNVVNASSSSSTAPVLALGAGSMGQLTIGTATPGTTLVQASTTAVGLKSLV